MKASNTNRELTFREEIFLAVKFPGKKTELLELYDILSLSLLRHQTVISFILQSKQAL